MSRPALGAAGYAVYRRQSYGTDLQTMWKAVAPGRKLLRQVRCACYSAAQPRAASVSHAESSAKAEPGIKNRVQLEARSLVCGCCSGSGDRYLLCGSPERRASRR